MWIHRAYNRDSSLPRPKRRGFTFLETEIAFVLLSIGLAGLLPLIVMEIRLSKKIEKGINPQTAYFKAGTTCYIVPSSEDWYRKLGGSAAIQDTSAPSGSGSSGTTPSAYIVSVVGPVSKALNSEAITVHVELTIRPTGTMP